MTRSESDTNSPPNPALETLGLFARGTVMGVAEILPGISGGTVALILGVYERMVTALSNVAVIAKDLVQMKFASLRRLLHPLIVLLPLLLGMLVGGVLAVNTIAGLKDTHREFVLGAIFGMVLGAVIFTFRSSVWTRLLVFLPLGWAVSMAIVLFPFYGSSSAWILIYTGGFLAFGAWILPGVSGSLVLVILGLWDTMIEAVAVLDWMKILVFLAGLISGWLLLSHPVRVLLDRYRNSVMALFCGLLIASLWKLWPWTNEGLPVLPHEFDGNPALISVMGLMAVGFGLVLVLSHVYTKNTS